MKFKEGDVAIIKAKKAVRPKYREESVRIEEVGYDGFDYKIHVFMDGLRDEVFENDLRSPIPRCESCESVKVHSTDREEWYCPWCNR